MGGQGTVFLMRMMLKNERELQPDKGEGLYIRGWRRGFFAISLGDGKIRRKALFGTKIKDLKKYKAKRFKVTRGCGKRYKYINFK